MAQFNIRGRLRHAWNAFAGGTNYRDVTSGASNFGPRPDRRRYSFGNERSIISSIYTRLGIDVAGIDIRHVRIDENDRYVDTIDSGLNNCLSTEANLDQGARQFRQDIVMTLCDKGVAALVPIDTTIDPSVSSAYDIQTMRVGEIVTWHPRHVRVSVYNEAKGYREQITLEKKFVAVVENPFYAVMNEPNSTLKRLIHKLNLLDAVDEQSSSGKLDMIIQLPYVIKSEARQAQAEKRRKDLEFQLKGSQYGIGYIDGTEKVTQLNRPAENNLLAQVEYLTQMLYTELGLTKEIMDGTADEQTMLNYFNRTIEPFLDAIVEAMKRTFLTKTARSQLQSIMYFRDPFKLVPIGQIADIADKFTRNEIASANDMRQVIGWRPSKDPKADQLINSNMPQPQPQALPGSTAPVIDSTATDVTGAPDVATQSAIDGLNGSLDDIFNDLGVDENALA